MPSRTNVGASAATLGKTAHTTLLDLVLVAEICKIGHALAGFAGCHVNVPQLGHRMQDISEKQNLSLHAHEILFPGRQIFYPFWAQGERSMVDDINMPTPLKMLIAVTIHRKHGIFYFRVTIPRLIPTEIAVHWHTYNYVGGCEPCGLAVNSEEMPGKLSSACSCEFLSQISIKRSGSAV